MGAQTAKQITLDTDWCSLVHELVLEEVLGETLQRRRCDEALEYL